MNNKYTENQEKIVSYNLDKIDKEVKVEVNLRDLVYVYRTLQEYVRFFHQPLHYPKIEDVEAFMGKADEQGAFKILNEAVYEKMRNMMPEEIEEMFNDGHFDSSFLPFYYEEKNET